MKTKITILFFFMVLAGYPCTGNTSIYLKNLFQEQFYSDTTKEEWKKIAEKERLIASQHKRLADFNAAEALKQKKLADLNASEAMKQRQLADRSASEAMQQKVLSEKNAIEAMKQKALADKNFIMLQEEKESAFQQVQEAKNAQLLSEKRIEELTQELGELKKIIKEQQIIIDDCRKKEIKKFLVVKGLITQTEQMD